MSTAVADRRSAAMAPAPTDIPAWAWLWFPPAMLVLAAVLRAIDTGTYVRVMESEPGVLEDATALVLVPAVAFGLMALRRRRSLPARWLGPWLMLLVAGAVYMAGEELSWGQHWFGWATPDWLAALNDQVETNLHNTSSWLDQKPRALFLLWVAVAGLAFPLARRVKRWSFDPAADWRYWFWPTGIVVPTAVLAVFIRLPEWIGDNVESLRATLLLVRYAEYQEYFFALFLTLYLGSFYLRLRPPAAA